MSVGASRSARLGILLQVIPPSVPDGTARALPPSYSPTTATRGTILGGLASVRVYILALAIVMAGLAAPFVMLSMQDDSVLPILSEPALDLLDLR